MKYRFTAEENAARQEALYSFLLSRGNKWTSMEQATDNVKEYPAYFRGVYHNSWTRRLLTSDIAAINGSDKFHGIIVSSSRGIKLANGDEFARFLVSETKEVFRKLARLRRIAKKGSLDQQMDLEGKIYDVFIGGE